MRRVIVDYAKLTDTILEHLVTRYPEGYDDEDIITFRNLKGEVIECVEVRTEDTVYLVKISKRLVAAMEDYELDDDEENTEEDDYSTDKLEDPEMDD